MAKKAKAQFPQVIYIARDSYFDGNYLIAGLCDEDNDLIQYDILAKYVLQEVGTVETSIKFVPDKK